MSFDSVGLLFQPEQHSDQLSFAGKGYNCKFIFILFQSYFGKPLGSVHSHSTSLGTVHSNYMEYFGLMYWLHSLNIPIFSESKQFRSFQCLSCTKEFSTQFPVYILLLVENLRNCGHLVNTNLRKCVIFTPKPNSSIYMFFRNFYKHLKG